MVTTPPTQDAAAMLGWGCGGGGGGLGGGEVGQGEEGWRG